jgi:hypothetical protein
MTAAALTPRVRMMAICDGVNESRTEPGVFTLKRVRQSIIAPNFPFVPRRLYLFLILSSARIGEFPCYIRIVQDKTNRTIYYTYLAPRPVFHLEHALFYSCAPITCAFPTEGSYTIEVCFYQNVGHDVLKGEMSFLVKKEGQQDEE